MDNLAERIARLSPAKQALLALRLRERERATAGCQTIPRRPGGGPVPLSFAQQRLWFLGQLEPDSPVYNNTRAFRIRGPLDVAALRGALDALVARHETLRTTFVATGGEPAQVIAEHWSVDLVVSHLAEGPAEAREAEVRRIITEEAQRPFDLSRDLMLRATLLRLDVEDHVLCVTIHHIVSDGWSMRILLAELGTLYGAFVAGKGSSLPDLPIQYADYAIWQRHWLQGEVLERQLAYWKRHLGGAPPALELPTDRPRRAAETYRGARESVVIPRSLADAVNELSRREGATLFMALLGAFQALLHRYAGQEDIVIGSPIAGRTRVETEGLIGFFVNTLALRVDLSGDPTFRELLGRVREAALGAYAHQDLPFEKLVEELQPERHLGRTPIFQVMFALQDARRATLTLPGLTVHPVEFDPGSAMFDLTLSLVDAPDGLEGYLEYRTDLHDAATVRRMRGHLHTLLEGIVADPSRPIAALPILTEAERGQLLVEWNAPGGRSPARACVHRLFEARAAQAPEAVAVVCGDRRLTYGELNRRANHLAHRLRALGVGPEVPVGVCLPRRPDAVVALLGVLKAGGAYVPLDPEYPAERLAFMLHDSKAPVVVTHHALRAALPARGPDAVCLDTDAETIARERGEDPAWVVTDDAMAYVIYTSGSTGQPKGVTVSHGALAGHCRAVQRYYVLTPADRVLQFASFSFDAALEQILPPLCAGARVVLRGADLWAPADFPRVIRELGLTVVDLPTVYWDQVARAWAGTPGEAPGPPLRLVVVGGEAMRAESLERWRASPAAAARLINAYGPTEATITATAFEVPPGWRAPAGCTVPLGRPLPGRTAYILDRHGNPVPVGVPGELHLGGAGLARGYLHRPELTAERFIPDPFGDGPEARLYRTGDRARYLPDGTLEFLGRADTQVKLRGLRIELGEIEAALGRHPAVRESVAVLREDASGAPCLVAYMVPAGAAPPEGAELRRFLRETLPDYMVPSAIVPLEAIPLTPSGKVDRRALPAPDQTRAAAAGRVAPRDPLELQLAQIWESVLGIRPVGIQDNFFELGGHSLLAVRLFAEIARLTGRQLPLAALFRAPTVGALAAVLRQDGWAAPWEALVPLQPGGSRPPLFCVHQHHGHIFWAQELARLLAPDQPVYGLTARGLDGRHPPRTRIEEMAAHYVQEIRTFQPEGPYHLCGYCFGGTVAFEMAQQLVAKGQPVGLLAMVEAGLRPWDAGVPRMLRRIRERVDYEVDTLIRLPAAERFPYLAKKALAVAKEQGERLLTGMAQVLPSRSTEDSHIDRAIQQLEAANEEALWHYVPRAYPGRLALFRPARPSVRHHGDPTWGWRELAAGGIDVHEIPGERPTIVEPPPVHALAEKLRACIAAAQNDPR